MGVRSRIGKLILRRIESSPRVQQEQARHERLWPFVAAARDAAYSRDGDEDARNELIRRTDLRSKLETEAAGVWDAVEWLGRDRGDYIGDRAYRLLTAAVAGLPVRPIDQAVAELFAREEHLGRQPLEQAFEELAALEPKLLDVRSRLTAARPPANQSTKQRSPQAIDALKGLVGVTSASPDPLLKTDLAHSIALQYLTVVTTGAPDGERTTPYFDAPRKASVRGGTLFGPQRPRAKN